MTRSRARLRLAPEVRREQILEAAYDEFVRRGYSATRLEHIAARAGVAKALPIFYFGSKAEIFRAVVKQRVATYLPDIASLALTPGSTWRERFEAVMGLLYAKVVKDPDDRSVFFLIATEGAQFPELANIFYQDAIQPAVQEIERLLAAGRREGVLRQDLSSQTAIAIFSGAFLAIQWRELFQKKHPINIEGLFKSYTDLVLRGLLVQ